MDVNNPQSEDSLGAHSSATAHCSNSKESLISISRSPVTCPITTCSSVAGPSAILSHFLRDHGSKFNVEYQQIISGQRSVLALTEEVFPQLNQNICLGVLIYAGKSLDEGARPGVVGLCRPNTLLPKKYAYLVNHLPIFIMGCKTTLASLIEDKELQDECLALGDPQHQIVVIWLTTVETPKPLECNMTAFNIETPTARSILSEVRNLKYSQEPPMFLPGGDGNYLMLTRGDLNLLSENTNNNIHLEIVVQEWDDKPYNFQFQYVEFEN